MTPKNPTYKGANQYKLNEYENKVTYTWKGKNAPSYTSTNGENGTLTRDHSLTNFKYFDSNLGKWEISKYTSIEQEKPIITLTNTFYNYPIFTFLSLESLEYKILSEGNDYSGYFLGNTCINTTSNYVLYEMCRMANDYVTYSPLTYSHRNQFLLGVWYPSSCYFII